MRLLKLFDYIRHLSKIQPHRRSFENTPYKFFQVILL